jgi:hypothetical protein
MKLNLASFSSASYKTAVDTSEDNITNTKDDDSIPAIIMNSKNNVETINSQADQPSSSTVSVGQTSILDDTSKEHSTTSTVPTTDTSKGSVSVDSNDKQHAMTASTRASDTTGPIAIKTNSSAGYQVLTPVKPSFSTSSTQNTETAKLLSENNNADTVDVTATPVAVRAMAQETPPPRNLDDQILTSLSEFDPLADTKEITSPTKSAKLTPQPSTTAVRKDRSDWMLQFETPMPQRIKLQEQLTARRTRLNRTTPKLSVLDLSFEFATPRSAPTYSERDVEMIRAKAEAEVSKSVYNYT